MNDALYSPLWHEVAALRPALRATVHCRRMSARGEAWQLLSAPESRQQLRINAAAWRLIGCLDGTRSLDTLWHALVERFGDAAPSQPEVLDLLAQLSAAGFLRADVLPDLPAQFDAAAERERKRRRAALSPLAVRVRLFDPGALLDALLPHCRALFSPLALALWVAAVLVTALVALSESSALAVAVADSTRAPRFVLIAWMVYPLMKALHELAHGLAIRHWGGRVANAGFTLLVLVPVPYVDASAANAFDRPRRIAVSAAGVMCELIIAAAAFWLWLAVAPGAVRDIALTAFFIGALSSLLVNGNPLLRFDGYYVFIDALDLPNLASRSRQWWHTLIGRRLLRSRQRTLDTAPGEAFWLALYAPAAWAFQLTIGVHIARWIGGFSPLAGLLTAALLIVTLV